jgi:hypothetical protein
MFIGLLTTDGYFLYILVRREYGHGINSYSKQRIKMTQWSFFFLSYRYIMDIYTLPSSVSSFPRLLGRKVAKWHTHTHP